MEWLNYHHLLYFWQVANEGTIAKASKKLHLTPQTISAQIKALEDSLGHKLFMRQGRNLVLTPDGEEVLKYADDIFALGKEMLEHLGRPESGPAHRLTVGVADVLSKQVVRLLLEPVFQLPETTHMVIHEDKTERLLAEISVQAFDVVLTDAPMPPQYKIRAYSHLLGESQVSLLAVPELAKKYRRKFPVSLNGAPFLLPTLDTELRKSLDHWFLTMGVRPNVIMEFADSALLKVFGETGRGIFAVPQVVESQVRKRYNVHRVGIIEDIEMHYYAISVEREIKHPAVAAITHSARQELFQRKPGR